MTRNSNIIDREYIKNKFNFLKENLPIVTWISTIIIAIISTILKLLKYVYERGITDFWSINPISISAINDTVLYDIIFLIASSILILLIMMIPYVIIKSNQKTIYKGLELFGLYILSFLINFIAFDAWNMIEQNGISGLISFAIANTIIFASIFSPSFIYLNSTSKNFMKNGLSLKTIYVLSAIGLLVLIIYFYVMGYVSSMNQVKFRITDDGYAIIYETSNHFYLAKYNEQENVIETENQKIIEKCDVPFTWLNMDAIN